MFAVMRTISLERASDRNPGKQNTAREPIHTLTAGANCGAPGPWLLICTES